MLEALVDHRRVSVVGANGSGKDWAAGRVVVWWEETHPEGKAIVMGPTQRQVEEIIWPEMGEAYAAAICQTGNPSARRRAISHRSSVGELSVCHGNTLVWCCTSFVNLGNRATPRNNFAKYRLMPGSSGDVHS